MGTAGVAGTRQRRHRLRLSVGGVYVRKGENETVIDLTRIFLNWQMLLVAGCLLVIFPVIFIVSSLDKTPVKIKRVKLRRRAASPAVKTQPPTRDSGVDIRRGDRRS